jgi:hypothetical protein
LLADAIRRRSERLLLELQRRFPSAIRIIVTVGCFASITVVCFASVTVIRLGAIEVALLGCCFTRSVRGCRWSL